MKKNELTYEQAFEKLETIVRGFESGTLDVDSLGNRLQEAQELLAYCKKKLFKVETEVKKILQPEA